MRILDAHHHLWDPGRLRYELLESIPELNRPFAVHEFERVAAANGIEASVCVEAASAGADGLAEAAWLRGQIDESALVRRLVLWAPVEHDGLDSYLDGVESWADERIVGFRRSFELEPPDFPARNEVVRGVRELGRRGYTFDVVTFARSLPACAALVESCPEITFVLDHLGKPAIRDERAGSWRADLARIARAPNVVCKISGLVTEASHDAWRPTDLEPFVRHALDCFGWDRVLFGSDWPVCDRAGGYERWLSALQECLGDASNDELNGFYWGNGARVYRLARHEDV